MKELALLTPLTVLEELHELADGRARVVKVDREVLGTLLVDCNALARAYRDLGCVLIEPAPIVAPQGKRLRAKLK